MNWKTLALTTLFPLVLTSIAKAQCTHWAHVSPARATVTTGYVVSLPAPAAPVTKPSAVKEAVNIMQTNPERLAAVPGQTIRARAAFLGEQAGAVHLVLGQSVFAASVLEWKNDFVIFTMPEFAVSADTPARVEIVLPTGRVARKVNVLVLAGEGWDTVPEAVAQQLKATRSARLER